MIRHTLCYCFTVMMLFNVSISKASVRHLAWQQGEPLLLSVALKEQTIQFPESVRLAVKPYYSRLFQHDLIDTNLYITPKQAFRERLTLQGLNSGRFYVLTMVAASSNKTLPTRWMIHVEHLTPQLSQKEPASDPVTAIELVQYAAQQLYAPAPEMIEPVAGIRRIAVPSIPLPNFYRSQVFLATPLASWTAGQQFVTAVTLRNQTDTDQRFEPCRLRGRFHSVTAQYPVVFPQGTAHDFTVVYVVSDEPFASAAQQAAWLCG